MRRLAILLGAVALTAPAIANAAEPLVLEPSSAWNIDYSPESCKLGRKFGEGENSITAIFTKIAPGVRMEGLLVGEGLKLKSRNDFDVSWWPNVIETSLSKAIFGFNGDATLALFDISFVDVKHDDDDASQSDPIALHRQELAAIAKVKEFRVIDGVRQPIVLRLGDMKAPMKARESCVDALVESWGLDPAVQRSLSRSASPKNNPGRWITVNDYPPDALERGSDALISFRLLLDDTGEITRCDPLGQFAEKDFSANLCTRISQRAKMSPALGPDGSPVKSYYTGQVSFMSGS